MAVCMCVYTCTSRVMAVCVCVYTCTSKQVPGVRLQRSKLMAVRVCMCKCSEVKSDGRQAWGSTYGWWWCGECVGVCVSVVRLCVCVSTVSCA